jgi:hypothetical protein
MELRMAYRRLSILAAAVLALLSGGPATTLLPEGTVSGDGPRKLALLIGINEYRSPMLTDLRGCVNDVLLMKTVLTNQFGFAADQVTALTDAQATRQGIIDAFQALIARARAGDVVLVHYSGHGARMKDASGDENDGMDETIVPHDSREGDVFDINDDELNGLLRELSRKTSNITVVLDSCHSGSATRGGATTRRAPDDLRDPPPPAAFALGSRGVNSDPSDLRTRDARYVLITGCRAHQLSNELEIDGNRQGVMTYHLARALREASAQATYRDIMDRVAGEVSAVFPSQEPELEGAGVSRRRRQGLDRGRHGLRPDERRRAGGARARGAVVHAGRGHRHGQGDERRGAAGLRRRRPGPGQAVLAGRAARARLSRLQAQGLLPGTPRLVGAPGDQGKPRTVSDGGGFGGRA